MKILVTGGRGNLGSCVTDVLAEAGHQVTVLARQEGPNTVVSDLRDRDQVVDAITSVSPDAIVHLAALTQPRKSFEEPLEYFDVNLGGTLALLDGASKLSKPPRFVFASTNSVYGSRHEGAIPESSECHPESPYAMSKYAAEQLIQAVAATSVISAVTLRIFNIAGAYNGRADTDTTRIIPNAFRAVTGELPHVTLNGDGSAMRDFVHVKDVASAVLMALDVSVDEKNYACFNVGSGIGTSMASVIDMVEHVTGHTVPVEHAPKKPEPQHVTADITHVTSVTEWRPTNSSLEAIVSSAWEAWDRTRAFSARTGAA